MAAPASLSDSSKTAHLAAYSHRDPDPRKKALLAISGGGIRGELPLLMLTEIEKLAGARAYEIFTHFAGTSVGSFIAAGCVVSLNGKEPLKADEMLTIFRNNAPNIFNRSWGRWLSTAGGLLSAKYDPAVLYSMIDTHFENTLLKDTLRPLFIPAVDLNACKLENFTTAKNQAIVASCVKASSAAATFFPPFKIGDFYYEDGGAVENNPAEGAYLNMIKGEDLSDKNIYVVSLGTGYVENKITVTNPKHAGLLFWGRNGLNLVLNGTNSMISEELSEIIDTPINSSNKRGLEVFNPRIDAAHDSIDDASVPNLQYLDEITAMFLEENKERMRETVRTLYPAGF